MTLVLHNSSNISSIEINFLPALIGSLIGFTSFLSIFANLTILIVLLHSNLIKSNPLYILSSLNLFNDIFHGFGFLVFLAPTSFAQNYFFKILEPFQPFWIFFMFVFQLSYYSSLLILMVIAINRMLTVVLPNSSKLTEERAVRFIAAIIYPTAFLLTLIADYVLPCCRTNYSYKTYSYQFFVWNENTINYKNNLIDLPLNIITTIIIFICYGAIIARVVIANRKDVIKLSTNIELKKNRRKSEIKCALHFALISTFHIAVWVSYRIFPLIVSLSTPEWYSLTGFFMILNISSNSIIYFTMNKEVQKQLIIFYRKLFGLPISNNLTIPTYLNNINLINSNSKNILNPNGQEKWANRRITQPQLINTSL